MQITYGLLVLDNSWQCICGEEWLADWVTSLGERNVADGSMGCLTSRACATNRSDQERRSILITVIASILAVVSLFILVAIAFVYVDNGKLCSLRDAQRFVVIAFHYVDDDKICYIFEMTCRFFCLFFF